MKKQFTLLFACLALLISSQAQPSRAKFSEKFQNDPRFEKLQKFIPPKTIPQRKSGDWYEPDTVYLYNTNGSVGLHTFSYENGKCASSIEQYWDQTYLSHKYIHTYNAFNNIKETLVQTWNKSDGEWEDRIKYIYNYSVQKNLIECILQVWEGYWANFNKIYYSYDTQNNVTEILVQWWDFYWENAAKMSYTYDSQNNKTGELVQLWINSGWVIFGKYMYIYDLQNHLIEGQRYKWDYYSEDWKMSDKWIYTYDTQNNMTEELFQSKNELDEWENAAKMSYTYDEHNNANLGMYQEWENNTWKDANGWLDLYYNNMKSMMSYEVNLFKITPTYIKPDINSIEENRVESVIKLYPNPTTGELTINNEQLTMNNIEIFDVYGRKVSSHHHIPTSSHHLINISHLPSGIYIVKMDGVCQKVVKL
jgi:hypothetical protein